MKVVPVKGPDGRLYFNLSDLAAVIEGSPETPMSAPREQSDFWAAVLRSFEAQSIQQHPEWAVSPDAAKPADLTTGFLSE